MVKIKNKCLSKIWFVLPAQQEIHKKIYVSDKIYIYINHVITNVPSIQQYCMKNKRTDWSKDRRASQEPMGKTISIKTIKQYVNVSTF